ncbi:hypothetical protein [Micromonospora sp. NPDC004704]
MAIIRQAEFRFDGSLPAAHIAPPAVPWWFFVKELAQVAGNRSTSVSVTDT